MSDKKTGASLNRGNSKQDYGTPEEFISACEKRFGEITFDLAATKENTKAENFFTPEMDSLKLEWATMTRGSLCFLNPPFSRIGPWAEKCVKEAELGARILFLVPASVGSNWFRDYVHNKASVLFLNGRITFIGETMPYPKDCMIVAYGFGVNGYDVWTWPQK